MTDRPVHLLGPERRFWCGGTVGTGDWTASATDTTCIACLRAALFSVGARMNFALGRAELWKELAKKYRHGFRCQIPIEDETTLGIALGSMFHAFGKRHIGDALLAGAIHRKASELFSRPRSCGVCGRPTRFEACNGCGVVTCQDCWPCSEELGMHVQPRRK